MSETFGPSMYCSFTNEDQDKSQAVYDRPELNFIHLAWDLNGRDGMHFFGTSDDLREILHKAGVLENTLYTRDDVPVLPKITTHG